MKIFDKTLSTLENALDVRLLKQNVLAGNVANVDTPGFVPKDVNFHAAMSAAERLDALGQTENLEQSVQLENQPGVVPGLDGNAVDLERTLVGMAQNALQYGATARAATKKLAILRFTASDGRE